MMRFIQALMIFGLMGSQIVLADTTGQSTPPQQETAKSIENPAGKKTDDFDGDKYYAHDVSSKWRDCNDRDITVHPFAWEKAGDGKIQDCRRDEDLIKPSNDTIKAFGCDPSKERAVDTLALEIERCDIDKHCQVLKRDGKGVFNLSHGWIFADWPEVNNKCDGIREVLDPERAKQVIAARGDKPEQFSYCPSTSKPRPRSTGTGTAAKAPAAPAPPAGPSTVDMAQDEVTVKLQEELAKTKLDLEKAIADAKTDSDEQNQLKTDFDQSQLDQETTDDAQNEKLGSLATDVNLARTDAKSALDIANGQKDILNKLAERSVLTEFTFGGLSAFQVPITLTDADGKTLGVARGTVAPGLALGMNLGYDGPALRLNGFGKIALVGDQVDGTFESGNVKQVGGEVTGRLGRNTLLGGHLEIHRHLSGGDVVEHNAISEGIGVGPSFGWASDREESFLSSGGMARLTFGIEALGTKGENIEKTTGFAPVILLSFDAFFGAGRYGTEDE